MSAYKQVNAARQSRNPAQKAKLGQNFLVDVNAARRIVEALGDISHSVVIEIGPGGGANALGGSVNNLSALANRDAVTVKSP